MDIDQNKYFTSYEDLDVHGLMLTDKPRTDAYHKAIMRNATFFKNKVVMDVGCGTGILSVFCAQAGAKKVYAVEASNLADLAKEIVKENNFDNIIEVIHSKVEDVNLPDDIKVDALVSEWMGFYLLHEGMLDSVLFARDKFLKEGGEMFPESAVIYVAPCSVPTYYDDWEDVYGVKMTTFAKHYRESKSNKPEIMCVKSEDLLGDETALAWISLREDSISDLQSFSLQYVLGAKRKGYYQGLCVWFECNFPYLDSDNVKDGAVILSTGPDSPATHWKQTVILLPEQQKIQKQEPIAFKLDMNKDETSSRRYNLELSLLDPEIVEHPLPCTCHMTKCILIKTFMEQNKQHTLDNQSTSPDNCGILNDEKIEDDDDDQSDED